MKSLPLWVRVVAWLAGWSLEELLQPALPAPASKPPTAQRAQLELQLRRLDGVLGVALGTARVDPWTGHYIIQTDLRWRQ